MKNLVVLLLISSIGFTSCTSYRYRAYATPENPITIEDLHTLKPGDKVKVGSKSGKVRTGRLVYVDSTSMTVKLFSKVTHHIDLREIDRIKYDENGWKTAKNVAIGTVLSFFILLMYILSTLDSPIA